MPYADPQKRREYNKEYRRLYPKPAATPEQNRRHYLSSGRGNHLLRTYGLTEPQVEELKDAQGGKCAICREIPKKFCVDHDHRTGEVRGLLCHRCNSCIAALEKSGWLEAAQNYLRKLSLAADCSEHEHMMLL